MAGLGKAGKEGIDAGLNLLDMPFLHNTDADKIARMNEMGGLPMPSVSVTKKDIPFEDYGDILPVKHNKVTGDYSLANTGLVEDVIRGLLDVGLSRKSGMVKPTSILDMF